MLSKFRKILSYLVVFALVSCALFPTTMNIPADNISPSRVSKINDLQIKSIPIDQLTKFSRPKYKILPRDFLSISVWGHPEFGSSNTSIANSAYNNTTFSTTYYSERQIYMGTSYIDSTQAQDTYLVDEEGIIVLPLVGDIKVDGLTLAEARSKIKKVLKPYINNANVKVAPLNAKNRYVNVMGEVKNPITLPISYEGMTLSQAINLSGGPNPGAKMQEIYVLRLDATKTNQVLAYNLDASNAASFAYAQKFYLQQDDIVYVSRHGFTQFAYVMQQLLPAVETFWFARDIVTPNSVFPWVASP